MHDTLIIPPFPAEQLEALRKIDEVADRFAAQWESLPPPAIEPLLQEVGPEWRDDLRRELLKVERAHLDRFREHEREGAGDWPSVPGPAGGGEVPAPAPGLPHLPGYELLAEVGRGSFGVVYRAREGASGRTVAVKMLLAGAGATERGRARFRGEGEALARAGHPGIVPLLAVGEHQGQAYLVLDYVDGPALRDVLRGQPQPPRAAAELVRRLAESIHWAHANGIVHRDLKPGNVLFKLPPGEGAAGSLADVARAAPMITDFDLAKDLSAGLRQSRTGEVLGTPSYMAPEQAEARHEDVGPATDVYALGVILYECLTGRPPFQGTTLIEVLKQVVAADPIPPSRLVAGVPRDLETVCLKCLEKGSHRRYNGARALADDLGRFLEGRPVVARPPGRAERVWRWCARRPLAVMAAACAAALLAGAMLFVSERARATYEARARAEAQLRALLDQARAFARSGLAGQRDETRRVLREYGRLRPSLGPGEEAAKLDLAARSLWVASAALPEVRTTDTRMPASPVFPHPWPVAIRPDGREMAIGTAGGPLFWRRGGELAVPADLDAAAERPRVLYTLDGEHVLELRPGGTVALYWDGGRVARWSRRGGAEVLAVGFRGAGEEALLCFADGWVQPLALPGLGERGKAYYLSGKPEQLTAAAFSPEGEVAAGDGLGRVRLSLGGGRIVELPAGRDGHPALDLAWSPDGRSVAVASREGAVRLHDRGGGGPAWSASMPGVSFSMKLAFTPDGGWLVVTGSGAGTAVFAAATGARVLHKLMGGGFLGLSADGRTLALTTPGEVSFADLVLPSVTRRYAGHGAPAVKLVWAADSRHFASLDGRYEARVWDRERPLALDGFRAPRGDGRLYAMNAGLCLSPDGRLVAYASGGRERAELLVRDPRKGADLQRWELPGGYESLAGTWPRAFVLVREEFVKGGTSVSSVARDVEPGKPLGPPRAIRRPRPGDGSTFLHSGLSADGRLYWWTGPRRPAHSRRLEVVEVRTGRPVLEVEGLSHPPAYPEVGACLCPEGRLLTVTGTHAWRYDLRERPPARTGLGCPVVSSPGARWSLHSDKVTGAPLSQWYLSREGNVAARVGVTELGEGGYLGLASFSPDGQFLAWPTEGGDICVMELTALEAEMEAFAAEMLEKR